LKKYFTAGNLAWLAVVCNVLGFVVYHTETFFSDKNPSLVSWFIFGLLTVLNFTSIRVMTRDKAKSLLPTVSSFLCASTFFVVLGKSLYARFYLHNSNYSFALSSYEVVCLVLGVIAAVVWKSSLPKILGENPTEEERRAESQAAKKAQVILQVALFLGFIPTFVRVATDPGAEQVFSWAVWTLTFALQTIVVLWRWKGQYMDLVYPVNMLVCHLAVALLTQYSWQETLSIISGLIFVSAFAPYLWSIVKPWLLRKRDDFYESIVDMT